MARIDEIAPDIYRLSIFVEQFNLQFNHFLVRDDEPLLFHTGYRFMFPDLRETVAKLIDPAKLRWIGFSHFESDECGALNNWLEIAPQAHPACTFLAATLNVNDFAIRPPRAMTDEEILETGRHRFRYCNTAHLPHGWDAGVLFEETGQTLFSSDLFFQFGEPEPLTESDIVGRVRESLSGMEQSPFAYSVPYTPQTGEIFERLAALKPKRIAAMHGSSYSGDGERATRELAGVIKEVFGSKT